MFRMQQRSPFFSETLEQVGSHVGQQQKRLSMGRDSLAELPMGLCSGACKESCGQYYQNCQAAGTPSYGGNQAKWRQWTTTAATKACIHISHGCIARELVSTHFYMRSQNSRTRELVCSHFYMHSTRERVHGKVQRWQSSKVNFLPR